MKITQHPREEVAFGLRKAAEVSSVVKRDWHWVFPFLILVLLCVELAACTPDDNNAGKSVPIQTPDAEAGVEPGIQSTPAPVSRAAPISIPESAPGSADAPPPAPSVPQREVLGQSPSTPPLEGVSKPTPSPGHPLQSIKAPAPATVTPTPAQDHTQSVKATPMPAIAVDTPSLTPATATMSVATDREALATLYNATGGPEWEINDNWMTDRPLGEWHGVTANEHGRVSELNLAKTGLTGPIPSEVGNLTDLSSLQLADNNLTGSIPPELGNLTDLTSLELLGNNLTGPIPPELGSLTNLTLLTLSDNNLEGEIPESLSNLESLLGFDFSKNSGLCAPPSLQFWLQNIQAWGARGPICAAPSAAVNADRAALVAFFNSTGGPHWTNNKNWLTDIPIWGWHGVTTDGSGRVVGLSLVYNNLTGPIPPELGSLFNLSELFLWDSNLTGPIPPELGNLSGLTKLVLASHNLSGPIPLELGNLTDLISLNLVDNNLTGPIPLELGNLTNLIDLNLADNDLTGTIPAELGSLSNLKSLFLSGNDLTGAVPQELGNLSNLTGLYLGHNQLERKIPESFSKLRNLRGLDLQGNAGLCAPPFLQDWITGIENLSGPLCPHPLEPKVRTDREVLVALYNATGGPEWKINDNWMTDRPLGEWHGVTTDENGRVIELRLVTTGLTGLIPPELGSLSNLTYMSLSGNRLSGNIPAKLADLTSLTGLELSGNNLTGIIPTELSSLSGLGYLNLASNNLTGTIPVELGNLSSLTYLSLAGNSFSGNIPPGLGNLSNLGYLNLGPNYLEGTIPLELADLTKLASLELFGNNLNGLVPPELDSLSNLSVLILSKNNLKGEIPASFSKLENLHAFDFRDNSGLCAPPSLQDWMQNIQSSWGAPGPICAAPSAAANADRAALVAFFNSTGGPHWTNNKNWLTDIPIWGWHGVTTDSSGRVVALSLAHNNLTGPIPPELGNLSNLNELYLQNNYLTGEIPSSFSELENLNAFNFRDNSGLCAPLSLQNWLDNLKGAYGLTCHGLMADITPLDNVSLARDRAALVALYDSTSGAKWGYNTNWLTDRPMGEWWGVTTEENGRVTELNLGVNNLTGPIPSELGSLSNLTRLSFYDNNLTGPIPPELGSLSNLAKLSLFGNNLSGNIPSELGNLTDLTRLELSDNNLTGPIPPELGNLTDLTELWLSSNNLTGAIPAELGNLSNLTNLSLGHNDLAGNIPAELGNLSSLASLGLAENNLAGTIPLELGYASNLTGLFLYGNQLEGEIPESFSRQRGLFNFVFDENDGLCLPLSLADWRRKVNGVSGPNCPEQ